MERGDLSALAARCGRRGAAFGVLSEPADDKGREEE